MSNRACSKRKESVFYPVPGWPGYEACEEGMVRHAATRRLLTPSKSRRLASGACYFTVKMADQTGKLSNQYLHAIIARTFLGPRPDGSVVAHKSDDASDCSIGNLYYATRQQNAADARRNGVRDKERRAKILAEREAGMDALRAEVAAANASIKSRPHAPRSSGLSLGTL